MSEGLPSANFSCRALFAEDDDLCERERIRMSDRKLRRTSANFCEARRGAAVQLGNLRALVCLPVQPFANHFFTTREWRLGEPQSDAADGWIQVAAHASVPVHQLGRLRQVHGSDVVMYKQHQRVPGGATPNGDIVLTDNPSVALAVQAADCVPMLVVDRRRQTVAAAHAGWRGLASR